MNQIELKDDERIDLLKQIDCKIIQKKSGFSFGIDAVLLADYVIKNQKKSGNLFDLCSGNGIIPLLLSDNDKIKSIKAIEIQSTIADMAQRSIELNNLQEKIQLIEGDIKNIPQKFTKHSFDIVTCNPPYMINEHGKQNPGDYKAIARHEILCNMEDVVKAADYLLKPLGSFYMIHRPFRLSEIFVTLTKYKLEPKKMRLVCPHPGEEANMLLIQAIKGANSRITVEKDLVVRNADGTYTEEINNIYQSAK
ncbi:MAG: tRNA1(Val) (adenine(37)-N6)-methyltransferase [Treponema sp.]|nr:tRNA1(Val) (adenine(37)-N6)-methyltransferase [Treponema sp.]